ANTSRLLVFDGSVYFTRIVLPVLVVHENFLVAPPSVLPASAKVQGNGLPFRAASTPDPSVSGGPASSAAGVRSPGSLQIVAVARYCSRFALSTWTKATFG